MRRLQTAVAAACIAAVAVTGCSQVAQLRPVAGDALITLRTVTIDTVLDSGGSFKTVPVCSADGQQLSCQGLTSEGQAVLSEGQKLTKVDIPSEFADQVPGWAKDSDSFVVAKVTVGQDVLYHGVAIELLDQTGRTDQ
jgi:hypothetical protein